MSVYYPRAVVRITATVQLSRTRDELEEVVFDAVPRSVKVTRNEFSKADECDLEFDAAKFPVLPRNVRQLLCAVSLGDARGLARELDESALLFLGYADDPELALSETSGTFKFKCRDYTALLLEARRPPLRIVPSYGDALDVALRRILDDIPGGENIKLALMDDGVETLNWPLLSDAAPPGLKSEKISYDPNDNLWKLIERVCDPFGLIPQIKLDTLEIGTPRGAARPKRLPLFVLGGPGGAEEYREKRNLAKIREGVTLSGYDLSTGSYIVAQWPPSGDASILKKLKATKVATGKSGKKKPSTVGANAAVVNTNEKRHGFSYGNVANQATLLEAARALYEGRSRQEFEGSFSSKRFRVPHYAPGEAVRFAPMFDVTGLTSGDRIFVDVLPEHRQLLAGVDNTQKRIALLEKQGFARDVASLLVKVYERGVDSGIEVYVRTLTMMLVEEGFSLDLVFQALLATGTA